MSGVYFNPKNSVRTEFFGSKSYSIQNDFNRNFRINLKNSVEFFPSRSSGALRAAYALANSARNALDLRPARRGILHIFVPYIFK
ncbi:MAG TPA: hypothetical protein DCL44_05925 [Elusimicrobia bacterium]|nr:hypothetical protein [Elusimicrobiota bacterium]